MRLLRNSYKDFTDEKLVAEMKKGNEKAFQEIYDRYAQPLYRYFHQRMWKDHEKAQDFVHDLLAKLIQNPDAFDLSRSFKTWIFSIANNMTINEYKKQSVRKIISNGVDECFVKASEDPTSDKILYDKQFKEALEKELENLDDKHREIFEMRHVNGFSNKEIAEILQMNEGTVK
jgi:RNA polymerase sigma-70 factor (ECF subfamily)